MATSIQTEELIWRKSNVMEGGKELGGSADPSANPANGGIMTSVEAVDLVKNAIFPDAPQSELTSGSLLWRKIFIHVERVFCFKFRMPEFSGFINVYFAISSIDFSIFCYNQWIDFRASAIVFSKDIIEIEQ